MNLNNNCIISKYGITCYNNPFKFMKIIPYFMIAKFTEIIIIDCYQKLVIEKNETLQFLEV